ncbi:putative inorganic phosphate cotransporter [Homarus americanus]|uniref:putative inorganic phosphate cotransporter n=1 Tax=Homarus americanus TaxID=6706 RepID=UPI001C46B3DE|nr:putative inorganic phosphate cotransporter [Homarus americanus]
MEFRGGSVLGTIQEAHSAQDTLSGYTHVHNTPVTPKPVFTISHSAAGWEDDGGSRKPSREEVQHDKPNLREVTECWGARHTLTMMLSLCLALQFSMRVNLSIAIVAMVGTTSYNDTLDTCPSSNDTDNGSSDDDDDDLQGKFSWDEQTQGLVLGAFYWGYATTNFVGGRVAEHMGGRLVLGLSTGLSSLATVISPLCAYVCKELFIFVRILEGACQGASFPVVGLLLATWIPPEERAKLASIVYSGSEAGTMVTLAMSGWLCGCGSGWPSAFYVFGVLGLVWCITWFLLVHDSPHTHPRITPAELTYIQSSLSSVTTTRIKNIPWKAIWTSGPMWAGMMFAVGSSFGFFIVLTELPTYLSNMQHFDLNNNGIMSGLPYLVSWIFAMTWGSLMDTLTERRVLSVTTVRRVSSAVGCYGFSLALLAMCFVRCNSTLAIITMCVALGLTGAMYSGAFLLAMEIAPNLAGTLVGISTTISGIIGFLAPVFTGAIINDNQTFGRWSIVFLVAAGLNMCTATFYMFFMSVDVQPWNDPTTDDKEKTSTADNGNSGNRYI